MRVRERKRAVFYKLSSCETPYLYEEGMSFHKNMIPTLSEYFGLYGEDSGNSYAVYCRIHIS